MVYFQLALSFGSAAVALVFLRLAVSVATLDRVEYAKYRARYPSFWHAVRGQAMLRSSDLFDPRARAWMVYNRRSKRIEVSEKRRNDPY